MEQEELMTEEITETLTENQEEEMTEEPTEQEEETPTEAEEPLTSSTATTEEELMTSTTTTIPVTLDVEAVNTFTHWGIGLIFFIILLIGFRLAYNFFRIFF